MARCKVQAEEATHLAGRPLFLNLQGDFHQHQNLQSTTYLFDQMRTPSLIALTEYILLQVNPPQPCEQLQVEGCVNSGIRTNDH